jgi:hypothetical protein
MVKQWPAHKTMWQSAHTNPAFVGIRSSRFSGIAYFAQAFPDCNAFRWPHGLIASGSSDSILAVPLNQRAQELGPARRQPLKFRGMRRSMDDQHDG